MAVNTQLDQLNDVRIFAESILDTIWEAVLVLDNELCVISANRSFYRQFLVSEAETQGRVVYELGNGQWNIPALRHALETIIPKNTSFENFVVEHTFQSLGKRIMLLNGRRINQEGGRQSLILLAINDITDRKRFEGELIKARERALARENEARQYSRLLQERNEELDTFNHTISHDLRAPLTVISGFAELLAEDFSGKMDAESKHYVDRICENVTRMDALIADLLALSKTTRQAATFTKVDMQGLVKAVAQEQKAGATGRRIDITIEPMPAATADVTLMRQVWANLIGNSIKFTRKRDIASIKIGAQDQPAETVYFVRDNGIGFDAKNADGLFELFQRLHPGDKYEGTGVGLAIVSRIIKRHGGRIWAEGDPEKGATFYFSLPKRDPDPDGMQGSEALNQGRANE